jgi:uncharacterized protein YpiB (UPF0302 family)
MQHRVCPHTLGFARDVVFSFYKWQVRTRDNSKAIVSVSMNSNLASAVELVHPGPLLLAPV